MWVAIVHDSLDISFYYTHHDIKMIAKLHQTVSCGFCTGSHHNRRLGKVNNGSESRARPEGTVRSERAVVRRRAGMEPSQLCACVEEIDEEHPPQWPLQSPGAVSRMQSIAPCGILCVEYILHNGECLASVHGGRITASA